MMYEVKSSLGENLKFSVEEIIFELKCRYDFFSTFIEVVQVVQDENLVYILSFEEMMSEITVKRQKKENHPLGLPYYY